MFIDFSLWIGLVVGFIGGLVAGWWSLLGLSVQPEKLIGADDREDEEPTL